MKNKKGLIGMIFIWIFIFVVGSLIVTFLVNPSSFQSFKSDIQSISSPLITNGISTVSKPTFECNEELNEWIRIKKLKEPSSYRLWVVEKKTFSNKEELVDYAFDLNAMSQYNLRRNLKDVDGEISSVLLKSEGRMLDMEYSNLRVFACYNGELIK